MEVGSSVLVYGVTDVPEVWRQIFRSAWNDFNTRFQHIIDSLRRHGSLVESQANIIQIQSCQAESARLQAALTKLEDTDHKEKRLSTLNWLSSTDVNLDQESYTAVWGEDSDSGLWILHQEKIRIWANPDSPLIPCLWVNGIPGAGAFNILDALEIHSSDFNRQDYSRFSHHSGMSEAQSGIGAVLLLQTP